jgi:protein-S-isoprenylcysteine O-methyltransferase Ste14
VDYLSLRLPVMITVGLVFFRHLQGAVQTFSVVRGERPPIQVQLFPLAAAVIFFQTFRFPLNPWLVVAGLIGFAGSLALFEWSRATVRGHFFSYAYSGDKPQFLLTAGPYAHIRNPFYTSYLLAYVSAAIMLPGLVTLAVLLVMTWFLASAARQEEAKFAMSPLAGDYEKYRRRTGRFVPRFRSL